MFVYDYVKQRTEYQKHIWEMDAMHALSELYLYTAIGSARKE